MPERIQLRRTKGWRKPEGAIVVARPSKWGNPYPVGKGRSARTAVAAYRQAIEALPDSALAWTNLAATYAEGGDYDRAIEAYEKAIQFDPKSEQARAGLEMARKLKAQVS